MVDKDEKYTRVCLMLGGLNKQIKNLKEIQKSKNFFKNKTSTHELNKTLITIEKDTALIKKELEDSSGLAKNEYDKLSKDYNDYCSILLDNTQRVILKLEDSKNRDIKLIHRKIIENASSQTSNNTSYDTTNERTDNSSSGNSKKQEKVLNNSKEVFSSNTKNAETMNIINNIQKKLNIINKNISLSRISLQQQQNGLSNALGNYREAENTAVDNNRLLRNHNWKDKTYAYLLHIIVLCLFVVIVYLLSKKIIE